MTRVGSLPLRFRQGPLSTPEAGQCMRCMRCVHAFDAQIPTSVHTVLIRKGYAWSVAQAGRVARKPLLHAHLG
jgi:hypothetical protein